MDKSSVELTNYLSHDWPVQRQYERRKLDLPIVVRCQGQLYRGWAVDISERGIGFHVPAQFAPADAIEIDLDVPGKSLSKVGAVICWGSGFRYGCEFVGATPEQQRVIAALVKRAK